MNDLEVNLYNTVLIISEKLDEINNRLQSIDNNFNKIIHQKLSNENTPSSKVEQWTKRLRKK